VHVEPTMYTASDTLRAGDRSTRARSDARRRRIDPDTMGVDGDFPGKREASASLRYVRRASPVTGTAPTRVGAISRLPRPEGCGAWSARRG